MKSIEKFPAQLRYVSNEKLETFPAISGQLSCPEISGNVSFFLLQCIVKCAACVIIILGQVGLTEELSPIHGVSFHMKGEIYRA